MSSWARADGTFDPDAHWTWALYRWRTDEGRMTVFHVYEPGGAIVHGEEGRMLCGVVAANWPSASTRIVAHPPPVSAPDGDGTVAVCRACRFHARDASRWRAQLDAAIGRSRNWPPEPVR